MTKQIRRATRKTRRIRTAFDAVILGNSRRARAKMARLPLSTFQYQYKKYFDIPNNPLEQTKLQFDCRNVLIKDEEQAIVGLVQHLFVRGSSTEQGSNC